MAPTPLAPLSLYREREELGIWEHRGKVAVAGLGCSPTARRWDGKPQTSVGAISIQALRSAMEDAGVSPDQVDGLVIAPVTTTGAHWPEGAPVPMDVVNAFNPTDDPLDGIAQLSTEWLLKNMPELENVKFTMYAPGCMSAAIVVAAVLFTKPLAAAELPEKSSTTVSGVKATRTFTRNCVSSKQQWTGRLSPLHSP